jgi:hypothetical protein
MSPSECADRLAAGQADIGLVPIASLAANPTLRILPGCTIASKHRVRSLLLVHRASQPLTACAPSPPTPPAAPPWPTPASSFTAGAIRPCPSCQHPPISTPCWNCADAAILIGDPALLALEEQANRFERTGEPLVYLDLAEEWTSKPACPSSPPSGALHAGADLWMRASPGLHPIKNPRPRKHRRAGSRMVKQTPHPRRDHPHLSHHQHPLCAG